MKLGGCIFNKVRFTADLDGNTELCLQTEPGSRHAARQIAKKIGASPEKLFTLSVSEGAGRRTLRQNAFMWAVCREIAKNGGEEAEDVYSRILYKYGVHDTLIVPEEALPRLLSVFRSAEVTGKKALEGKSFAVVRCTYGSSSYDTSQMSALIDGLLNEAANSEINTDELQYLANNEQ